MTTASIKRISITLFNQEFFDEQVIDNLVNTFNATRYGDAYHIKQDNLDAFLFEYGVLVAWDISEPAHKIVCEHLSTDLGGKSFSSLEQYSYTIDVDSRFSIRHDTLTLPDNEALCLLGLSHAFAQSAQLEFFESKALNIIQENSYITKELAQTGHVNMTRRELAKLRGKLYDTTSDITLHFSLLDTPEFFGEYPELEENYYLLLKYLDFQQRIDILEKKIVIIQKLLNMIADEQNHKHSAFLEWIIIVYFFKPRIN